jgi:uncharacterized protein
MKFIGRCALLVAIAYVALCAYMFAVQRNMQYRPDPSAMNPSAAALPNAIQESITTRDGERIVTWWVAPRDTTQPVFLYLHGNGANLHARAARFAKLTRDGAGLLAVSWRGYGGSSGSPTEAGLRTDARAAYDTLVAAKAIDQKRIVVFGESLGTTVATLLAAEVSIAALVLDSSFDSAIDVASRAYPWLPVRWLLIDTYRADLAAANVRAPVQQFHCANDPITPLASAQQLRERFSNAAPIHLINASCHVPSITTFDAPLNAFVRSIAFANR